MQSEDSDIEEPQEQTETSRAPPEDALFGGPEMHPGGGSPANGSPAKGSPARAVSREVDTSLRCPIELRGTTNAYPGAPYGFNARGVPRKRPGRTMSEEEKEMLRQRMKNPEIIAKRVAARKAQAARTRGLKAPAPLRDDEHLVPPPPKVRTVTKTVVEKAGPSKEEIDAIVAERLEKALTLHEERRMARKEARKKAEADEAAKIAAKREAEEEALRAEEESARKQRVRTIMPSLGRSRPKTYDLI